MKKTALCATLALILSACLKPEEGGGGTEDDARNALPTAANLHIDVPAQAAKAPVVGQVATFYLVTLGTAVTLNGGAAVVLILVKTITAFPVTSIEGDTYIWGPWRDPKKPSEYRLTVRQDGEGRYVWALEGRLVADGPSAPYLMVVSGLATPGHPHRGSGTFTIDFDTGRLLDPASKDEGQVSVTYDLESQPITVEMDAERQAPTPDGGSAPMTFHYEYSQNANSSGELSFMVYGDTVDPGSAWEMSEIHSRWDNTGAGRADVSITGGDVGVGAVQATECWDSSFRRTYYVDSVLWTPTEGDPDACVF